MPRISNYYEMAATEFKGLQIVGSFILLRETHKHNEFNSGAQSISKNGSFHVAVINWVSPTAELLPFIAAWERRFQVVDWNLFMSCVFFFKIKFINFQLILLYKVNMSCV